MKTIYLFGHCSFETHGVYHLLTRKWNVINCLGDSNALSNLSKNDVLVMCLSSLPTIGWGAYLSQIKKIALSYDARIIVLTPRHIPRIDSMTCSKQVFFINGTQELERLYRSVIYIIKKSVLNGMQDPVDVIINARHYQFAMDIINKVSVIDRAKIDRIPHKTIYHRRGVFLRQLGFSSLLHLQLFLSGISQKDLKLLCSSA